MATQTLPSPVQNHLAGHGTVKATETEMSRVPVVTHVITDEDMGLLQVSCKRFIEIQEHIFTQTVAMKNHVDSTCRSRSRLEDLHQLPDTASYRTVRVFRLVPFTYQLEYHCLSAIILKYDSLFLSGCLLADLCTLFLPRFHPISCQVWAKK